MLGFHKISKFYNISPEIMAVGTQYEKKETRKEDLFAILYEKLLRSAFFADEIVMLI